MSEYIRSYDKTHNSRLQILIASAIVIMTFSILISKLWRLQLIEGEYFSEMSYSNRTRLLRLAPPRGSITDCNGKILAQNQPNFSLSVFPGELREPEKLIEIAPSILGISPERMRIMLLNAANSPKYKMFQLKRNLSIEEVSLLKSNLGDTKGVVIEAKPYRQYPYRESLCHVLGTLGEISSEELMKSERFVYKPGDLVGKTGIEKDYESYLKGEEGWNQIEIDAKGRQIGTTNKILPQKGADIMLTLDIDLQKYVEQVFVERAGSVVALDPETGRVLALVSKPDFDLNLFSPSISERNWKNLNSDPLHPLENRAIRGLYAPGSTFKMVTAMAGLSYGVIRPETTFDCAGELEVSNQTYRCWKQRGHGKVSLHKALVESCDVYFYELGLSLGADRIAKYASLFGFGTASGIELSNELPGLVPNSAWKQRRYGSPIKDGDSVTMSIGQGYLLSTPIQMAAMMAAVANNGKVMKPYLIHKIVSADGGALFENQPVQKWDTSFDYKHIQLLQKALKDVVEDKSGTGRKSFIPGLRVHAKTGTSQVITEKDRITEMDQVPYHERTHAMFVAYVNDRPKKIALSVIVEHGGGGGAVAAPIARKILCKYYDIPESPQ